VHTTSEEKRDDSKDSFHEELEQVSDNFTTHHTTIMLGDLIAKFGRDDVYFKTEIGNESLYQGSKDNGVKIANFATSTILVVKNTMYAHQNFKKYTGTFPDGKNHNQIFIVY
jgi:hypothetical protein